MIRERKENQRKQSWGRRACHSVTLVLGGGGSLGSHPRVEAWMPILERLVLSPCYFLSHSVESGVTTGERLPLDPLRSEHAQCTGPPGPERMFPFVPERAKKVRNKAVVNTAALTPESRTENSKLLLGGGNSSMAGKLSQRSMLSPSQQPEGALAALSRAFWPSLWGKKNPQPFHFEINVDSHAVVANYVPAL